MEVKKEKVVKKNQNAELVYIDLGLLRQVSLETKEKILHEVNTKGYRVFTSDNPMGLLKFKKPTIHRYGILPTVVATRLAIRGTTIISGNY